MTPEEIQELAINKVKEINPGKQVAIVWYCKTLQHSKMLITVLGTSKEDYIEATYNGDTGELYLDVYDKAYQKIINTKEEV